MENLNFTKEIMDSLYTVPLTCVGSLKSERGQSSQLCSSKTENTFCSEDEVCKSGKDQDSSETVSMETESLETDLESDKTGTVCDKESEENGHGERQKGKEDIKSESKGSEKRKYEKVRNTTR